MLNIFVCLLLAHVFSDFVFQSNFIYKLKTKSKFGLYLHVIMFFVLSFLLCVPFSFNFIFIFWLLVVTISHYFIDKIKLFFQRNIIKKELTHFFIDQSLHVLMLCSFFVLFKGAISTSLFFELIKVTFGICDIDALLLLFKISFSVYVAFGISVILYYYDRTVDLQVEMLKHNYFSMFIRVSIFLLLISNFFIFGFLAILFLRQILKKRLIYGGRRFVIEHLTLFFFIIIFLPIQILIGGIFW